MASHRWCVLTALCIGLIFMTGCTKLLDGLADEPPFSFDALLLDSATTPDVEAFQQGILAIPSVQGVDYVSKEQALLAFKRDMADEPQIIEDLDGHNPLPASLVITLRPNPTTENLERVTGEIERLPQFHRVVRGADLPDGGWWKRYKGE